MKEHLNADAPDDAQGALQDIYWLKGAFGRFLRYLLGAMTAAQFFRFAEQKLPNLKGHISRWQFSELREHLKEKAHEIGLFYSSPDELLKTVAGELVEPKSFLEYPSKKCCDCIDRQIAPLKSS